MTDKELSKIIKKKYIECVLSMSKNPSGTNIWIILFLTLLLKDYIFDVDKKGTYNITKELKYLLYIKPFLLGTKDKNSTLYKPFQSNIADTKVFKHISSFL